MYGYGGHVGAGQASGSQLGFGLETFNTSAEASCEDFRPYRQRPSPLLSWRPQKYKASSVRTASPPGSTSTPVASLTPSGTVIRRGEIRNQISGAASSTIVRLEPQVCTASSQRTAHVSTYDSLRCTPAAVALIDSPGASLVMHVKVYGAAAPFAGPGAPCFCVFLGCGAALYGRLPRSRGLEGAYGRREPR